MRTVLERRLGHTEPTLELSKVRENGGKVT